MHWFWRATIAVVAGTIISALLLIVGGATGTLYGDIAIDAGFLATGNAIALAVYDWRGRMRKGSHETRCRRCGYILRGISEPRCPECGERI
jgi:hypothetical protein